MTTGPNYILARDVTLARQIAEGLGWSRVPMETAILPVFLTPKGRTVCYVTCEGLVGRQMNGSTIFITYGYERNCMHRPDILEWAKSRGANLVRLYSDDTDEDECEEF